MSRKRNTLQIARRYVRERRRKQRWLRVVTVLAAVVVFCTTYALILPAITMEKDCTIPEHTHTDACYAQVTARDTRKLVCTPEGLGIHRHTEDCLDTEGNLICGLADFAVHTHDSDCYDKAGVLLCTLPEIEAHQHEEGCYTVPEAHVHGDGCRTRQQGALICTESTEPLHTHSEDCYSEIRELICEEEHEHSEDCYTVQRELTCAESTEPAHVQTDECYEWTEVLSCDKSTEPGTPVLTCEKEEVILHTHESYESEEAPGCYDKDGNLICGIVEVLEHQHDDSCFETVTEPVDTETLTCTDTDPEHQHTARCYGTWVLACKLEEHTHAEGCVRVQETESTEQTTEATVQTVPAYLCGLEEHQHGDACTNDALELTCGQQAHTHTAECTGETRPSEYLCGQEAHTHAAICRNTDGELLCGKQEHDHTSACRVKTLHAEGADYAVTVRYTAEAALPLDVTLSVREIPGDSEEYRAYLSQAKAAIEDNQDAQAVLFARFFDVQFLSEGEKVEPAAPVDVTITYNSPVQTATSASCQAVHFASSGAEVLDVSTEQKADGSVSFTHTQNGFSVVGNVVAMTVRNSADNGPDPQPVDYYVCIDGVWTCVGSTKTGWYAPADATSWGDSDRDYITTAQVASILGPYGFTGNEPSPARVIAYRFKTSPNIYSDTNARDVTTESGGTAKVIPLSRNNSHPGYNLYYLPKNDAIISNKNEGNLDKTANGFYTVKVFDAQGTALTSKVVPTGGSFTYEVSDVDSWLAAYGNGTTEIVQGPSISLSNITAPVILSPASGTNVGSHSVTFKVMVDGQWTEAGSLPYYYSGIADSNQRAYITSAMAAQILGDYGYTATAAPADKFGYSYNDIYKIFYAANTGYCMDVSGNTIANGTAVQLWTSNTSTAQIFRIWDADSGYKYITPVENSAYHLNVLGGGITDGTKLGIHTATDAASHWKVVSNSDGTTSFYNRNAPDTAAIDLPSGNVTTGNQLQIWTNGGNRYWKPVQQYRITSDIVSADNGGGTYKIGLTPESNGDIVCYYLPSGGSYTNAAEDGISAENSFWTVSVRDDTNAVYSDGDLSGMVQIVPNGDEATVTVSNANGILWSCVGVNGSPVEVESTQSGNLTTFTIRNINQPVEVVATKANPSFTVQYYANIPRFATSGSNPLTVIDTSASGNSQTSAKLPTNGGTIATKSLYLTGTGRNTTQNAGTPTELYKVKTVNELTKMYRETSFEFAQSPDLYYFNKLKDNEGFTLSEIWVLKDGKSSNSTKQADWDIHDYVEGLGFTNEAGQANDSTILIKDNAILRLVFDSSTGTYHNDTTFYDYNISSGQNADGRWRTGITGINIESNYGTSLNGQRTWRSGADILAFGNANCGTGMSGYVFDGSTLNKYSQINQNYGGTTFKLAAGLNDDDNTIRYNPWIVAPKLFNDGDATGKQTYSGSTLDFARVGDTYTLTTANLNNSNGQTNSLSGLDTFFHPSPDTDTIHTHIFTNNFWPMDQAAGRTDALWGAVGNPGSFQGFAAANDYNWSALAKDFPISDDGKAHNWFFGMYFSLSFTLDKGYVGPLEYYFFGDDDMWVFLDSTLICDIGGVHSSVGEYVNLRDYLPEGSYGQHKLSFFYTERGASGSTCWMSFTLPSVTSATTIQNTGSLQIAKALTGVDETVDYSGVEYEFQVELLNTQNGTPLNQTFSFARSDGTYGTVRSGGIIELHRNETATIQGIPTGTFYRVTELHTEGYHITVNDAVGHIVSGTMETGAVKPASFVNTPYTELPSTGGAGTILFTTGGLTLILGAALLLYVQYRRRKEDAVSS